MSPPVTPIFQLHVPRINQTVCLDSEISYLFLTLLAAFTMVIHHLPVWTFLYICNLRKELQRKKRKQRSTFFDTQCIVTQMCYQLIVNWFSRSGTRPSLLYSLWVFSNIFASLVNALTVGLQGSFKEIELQASGQDQNDQTLIIAPLISLFRSFPTLSNLACSFLPLLGKVRGPLLIPPLWDKPCMPKPASVSQDPSFPSQSAGQQVYHKTSPVPGLSKQTQPRTLGQLPLIIKKSSCCTSSISYLNKLFSLFTWLCWEILFPFLWAWTTTLIQATYPLEASNFHKATWEQCALTKKKKLHLSSRNLPYIKR